MVPVVLLCRPQLHSDLYSIWSTKEKKRDFTLRMCGPSISNSAWCCSSSGFSNQRVIMLSLAGTHVLQPDQRRVEVRREQSPGSYRRCGIFFRAGSQVRATGAREGHPRPRTSPLSSSGLMVRISVGKCIRGRKLMERHCGGDFRAAELTVTWEQQTLVAETRPRVGISAPERIVSP